MGLVVGPPSPAANAANGAEEATSRFPQNQSFRCRALLTGPILTVRRGVIMTAKRIWIGVAIVAVAVAVILYFVLYGGGSSSSGGGGGGGY